MANSRDFLEQILMHDVNMPMAKRQDPLSVDYETSLAEIRRGLHDGNDSTTANKPGPLNVDYETSLAEIRGGLHDVKGARFEIRTVAKRPVLLDFDAKAKLAELHTAVVAVDLARRDADDFHIYLWNKVRAQLDQITNDARIMADGQSSLQYVPEVPSADLSEGATKDERENYTNGLKATLTACDNFVREYKKEAGDAEEEVEDVKEEFEDVKEEVWVVQEEVEDGEDSWKSLTPLQSKQPKKKRRNAFSRFLRGTTTCFSPKKKC